LDVTGWGKQQNKQRFKCKSCGLLFTNNDKLQTIENRFIWFKKWVVERQTYKTFLASVGLPLPPASGIEGLGKVG
jgi:transposase-like protein